MDGMGGFGWGWSGAGIGGKEERINTFFPSDSDDPEQSGKTLPIPAVQYEWGDAFTSSTPIGRYSCSTISR